MKNASLESDSAMKNRPFDRAVFLEADGVIKTDRFGFNDRCMQKLAGLLKGINGTVILYSDRKKMLDDDGHAITPEGEELLKAFEKYRISMPEKTPCIKTTDLERYEEEDLNAGINAWLSEHPEIKEYAILGDREFKGELRQHAVCVNPFLGLRTEDVSRARIIMHIPPSDDPEDLEELEKLPGWLSV